MSKLIELTEPSGRKVLVNSGAILMVQPHTSDTSGIKSMVSLTNGTILHCKEHQDDILRAANGTK